MRKLPRLTLMLMIILLVVGCNDKAEVKTENGKLENKDNESVKNTAKKEKEDSETIKKRNEAENKTGLDVGQEFINANTFYQESYKPTILEDDVLSDSMRVVLTTDGDVVYESMSRSFLKDEAYDQGMQLIVKSEVLDSKRKIQSSGQSEKGKKIGDKVFDDGSAIRWNDGENYYALSGGRSTLEVSPEEDRFEAYNNLEQIDKEFVHLSTYVDKLLIPDKLPDGFEAVEIGYIFDPWRGYQPYETEIWIKYEDQDDNNINMNMYAGYEDMAKSDMREPNKTIEGLEVRGGNLETRFILEDIYYEIDHKDLSRDDRNLFMNELLKE